MYLEISFLPNYLKNNLLVPPYYLKNNLFLFSFPHNIKFAINVKLYKGIPPIDFQNFSLKIDSFVYLFLLHQSAKYGKVIIRQNIELDVLIQLYVLGYRELKKIMLAH